MVAALHELTRVLRRARRRWLITLLVAGGLTSLVVFKLARKPQIYSSRAVLRMTEADFSDTQLALQKGELEDYLWNVAFSQKIVYPILEELDLYPDMRELGAAEAVEAFREDIDVEVFGNFFLQAGSEESRTVRVAITYSSLDPVMTVKVVERLANEVIAHERERHIRTTERMESEALHQLDMADNEVVRRERRLAEIMAHMATAEDHERRLSRVEAQRLQMEIHSYNTNLTQARNDLTTAKVLRGTPIAVDLARLRTPEIVTPAARKRKLIIFGVLGFMLLLPTAAIVIGAFDTRVRNSEDIERIGLPVVGHIPGFRGDSTGTLLDRLPKRRWWQRRRLT